MKYTANRIKHWEINCEFNGNWIPARPINYMYESFGRRIKHAWFVLIGRYDALDWEIY